MFGSSRYKVAKRYRVPVSKGYKKQALSNKKYILKTKKGLVDKTI